MEQPGNDRPNDPASPGRTKTRILVVDDAATVRETVKEVLNGAGYAVTEAEDGLKALEIARGAQFDVVLSDIQMPNMDGLGLIAALRAEPQYQDTPILVLSTMTQPELVRQGREAGANAWFFKPCQPDVLLKGIDRILKAQA